MANNSASYNVNMRFTADTGQAKLQLRDLQSSLDTLMNLIATKNIKFFDVNATKKEIDEASAAVLELKIALDLATNVNTGRLDLSKFSKSLSLSGYTLLDFATHLENLGPTGDKAFVALALSVINAEVPLKRTNKILDDFKKTLANTAKWQISSNFMHGVQGSLLRAYYYAEDLNKSLNEIRIVTGLSSDLMANFAEKANKAAQALSTTTTNYTNASLIYYQLGLTDQEVADRTEVTIKMANAAGESASKVSDLLTAVWNNFYDGSKSLKYYADVMTKLGAYTASSTDEISEGVLKFASVANTIGLSYEYATSALATLTAKTRESADTVGNSLKTLFARIQGLSLGETLEDGTDLNKYSVALEKVGISIKDQQGELKDMNTILDEMMDKWDSLSRAEQVALALTVGGVRQYTQLVNLMENKDYFKELVGVAKNSEGALQELADIYAESWEASKERVLASLEEIYHQLVDDKFFIGLNDTLSDTLNITSKLIDSLGGLPGVLGVVSNLMLKSFGPDIVNNMQRMASNLFIDSGAALNLAAIIKQLMVLLLLGWNETEGSLPIEWQASTTFLNSTLVEAATLSYDLLMATERLNETDKLRLLILKLISDKYAEIAYNARVSLELADANVINVKRDSLNQIRALLGDSGGALGVSTASGEIDSAAFLRDEYVNFMNSNIDNFNDLELINKIGYLNLMGDSYESLNNHIDEYSKATDEASKLTIGRLIRNDLKELLHLYGQTGTTLLMLNLFTDNYIDIQEEEGIISREQAVIMKRVTAALNLVTIARTEDENSVKQYKNAVELFNDTLAKSLGAIMTFSQGLVSSAQGISSFAIGINSIRSAIETLNNTDLTFGEKVLLMTTSLSIALPSFINGFSTLSKGLLTIIDSKGLVGTNLLQIITGLNEIKGDNLTTALDELNATSKTTSLRFKALSVMSDAYKTSISSALIGVNGLTLAMAEQTAGAAALKAGIKAVATSLGIYVAIAAAIAAVIAVIIHLNEVAKTKTLESQLARSEEAAANFEELLSKTKSKAEELKNVFNNYKNIKASLDECTTGTEEWRKKLQETNEIALEILKNYPELKNIEGAWGKKDTGEIWIDESVLKGLQSNYDNKVLSQSYNLARLNLNSNELENSIALKSAFEDITFLYQAGMIGNLSDSFKPEKNGKYFNPSEYIKNNFLNYKNYSDDLILKDIYSYLDKEGYNNIKDLVYYNNLTLFINEINPTLQSLISTIEKNTDAALQVEKESIVQLKLGKTSMSSQEARLTTEAYDKAIEEEIAKMKLTNREGVWTGDINYEGLKITKLSAKDNDQILNLWNTYLKSLGIDISDTDYRLHLEKSIEGKGQDKYFVYGDNQLASFELVIQAVALYNVDLNKRLVKLNTNVTDFLTNLLSSIYTIGDNENPQTKTDKNLGKSLYEFIGNKGFSNFNTEELNNINELTLENLERNVAEAMGFDYNSLTEGQLAELTEQLNTIYSAAGLTSAEEFIAQFNATLRSTKENDTISDFSRFLGIENIDNLSNFSIAIKNKISTILEDAFEIAGHDGVNTLIEAINASGSDITLDQLDLIESIFKTSSSVDDFIKLLKKLGLVTDESKEAWIEYYNKLVEAGNNLPITLFENFRQVLSDIISILNGDIGSIISQEAIDNLEKFGIDWQKYFVQTGPDQYTLVLEFSTEDKNLNLAGTIQLIRDNGQFALDLEQAWQDIKIDNDKRDASYSLDEWALQLINGEASDPNGVLLKKILEFFGGADKLALFAGGNADEFTLEAWQNKSNEEKGSLINRVSSAFSTNKDYDNQIKSAILETYANASSIKELNEMTGFDLNDETSQLGLLAWAAKNQDIEGVSDIISNFNYDLEEAKKLGKDTGEVYEKFFEELRGAEIKQGIKNIKDYKKNIADLEKQGKDTTEENKKLKTEIKDLFNLTESLYRKAEKAGLILKFLYGDEAELQSAGKDLENFKGNLNEAYSYAEEIKNKSSKFGEFSFNFDSNKLDTETSEFTSKMDDIISKYGNFNLNGEINLDTTDALTNLIPVSTDIQDMCGWLNAMGRTGINFDVSLLNNLFKAFEALANAALRGDTNAIKYIRRGIGDIVKVAAIDSIVPQDNGHDYTTTIDNDVSGGGGGSSSSAADIGKSIQDERLKTYEKKRELLETKRDGANPDEAAKYIQEEIDLLEEEQEILEQLIKSWKLLLKLKVDEFNKKHPEFEIKLTDDGEIANASELWGKVWAEYEKNLNNGMSEEELNEWFTEIKDALDGPMGIQLNIDENVALIALKEKEQAELELEAITKAIDWKVKQIDFLIKRLNYYQEKLLKLAHGNKQTIEAMLEGFAYQEQEMLQLFDKGATLREGIDQLNEAKTKYPDLQQMFDELILEYQSDLIDVNEAILDLRADIEDLVLNVLDLALDEIDKLIERLDTYTSMLDHLNNIIDLSGRSMLDMGLKTLIGATKVETMLGKMKSLKAQMDGLTKATKEAQEALANREADGDETSVKFWENQVEVLKQETEKASEEFLASWEETLLAAQELFEMRVEMAVNTLANALSPFETLEDFQDKYEKAKTINEEYIDDAERLYELNKLNRQLNLLLNDTNDLLAKQKLKEILQEINDLLADGVQMSQYDLEYLQKKYDLQLAEIALMELQNSKTSMRLIRDAAGNWTYAYDADEEKIEDATLKYEDAVYELGKLSKDYINDVSELLILNQIDFKEALQGLDKNSADYSNLLLALQEYYVERQRYLLDELNKGVVNSGLTFHDTLYGQMTDLYDYNDAYMLFVNNSNATISELQTNYKDWQKVVEAAMNVAGTSWDDFGTDMGGTLDSLEEHIQKLCDEIEELVKVLMDYISLSIGMVADWEAKYSKRTDLELAANESYIDGNFISSGGGRNTVGVDLSALALKMLQEGLDYIYDLNGNKYDSIEDILNERNKKLDNISNELKNGSSSETWGEEEGKWISENRDLDWLIKKLKEEGWDGDYGGGAAIGAYTGNWGPGQGFGPDNGKIIKVHPKELILNKSDTSNILRAVDIVRSMNDWVDKQVLQMINFGSSKLNRMVDQAVPPVYETQPIKLEVTIQAEFPGVTDHYEIEEALSNLSNNAAQYISAKKIK